MTEQGSDDIKYRRCSLLFSFGRDVFSVKTPVSLVLVLCISVYSAAGATAAWATELDVWQKAQERLQREAIELFRVILQDDKEKPAPCEFRAKWLEYPIPAQYFESKLSADLVPSNIPADPVEILDPSGTMEKAFCNEADDELRLSFLVENLKRKELRDENDPKSLLNGFAIDRREYTFPIFDKNYRRAVIVSSNLKRSWYWWPNGKFRPGIESDVGASFYEKRNGRWRFIRYKLFAAAHG